MKSKASPAALLKTGIRADFLRAVANSCPPFERLSFPFELVPAGGNRYADWVAACCPEEQPGHEALIAATGRSVSDLERAFGACRLVDGGALPAWASCAELVLAALPASALILDSDPATGFAEHLVVASAALLDWSQLVTRHPFLTTSVLAHLTLQLSTRILSASWSVLELEGAFQPTGRIDVGRDAWLHRMSGFAGLCFPFGTAIRQWRETVLEIIWRLADDRDAISTHLCGPGPLSRLLSITGDCGDRHSDGRSVAILAFEDGERIVYKPKDLRCSAALMTTMAALDVRSEVRFATRRIICRTGYAWEEFVVETRVTRREDAAVFFVNYGGLIRLLQIIDGRDFWADNLKVQGTLPAFIDFECIMHPRLRIPEADADARRKRDEFEDSPLASAVISHRLAVAGGSEEFGGLSPPGERKLPMRGWASSSDRRHGSLRLAAGQIYWTAENAWPVVEGAHAQAAAYTAELEHGYRAIHALLLRSACDFATRGPLAGMGASPVRVLLRSTWEYLDALRASLEPPAMLDGVERELALAPIVRGAPAWPADDDGLSRYRIAIAEAASVRRLDVPEFHSLPSDQSLLLPDGQSVPEFFDETALGRFRRRVEQLPQFDVERHLEVIRTTVEAMGR